MKKIYFIIIGLIISSISFGQVTATYNTAGSNTWICPAGVTSITVKCWGAGGGGGGSRASGSGGAGGGAGGYVEYSNLSVIPGVTYTVIVGTGGTAGTTGTGDVAGSGGSSSFANTGLTINLVAKYIAIKFLF